MQFRPFRCFAARFEYISALAGCAALVSLHALVGCTAPSRGHYPVPRAVLFDAETGAWTVEVEGVGRVAELPVRVPIETIRDGERLPTLALKKGTQGYRTTILSSGGGIRVADAVKYRGGRWFIEHYSADASAQGFAALSQQGLAASVPVYVPGREPPSPGGFTGEQIWSARRGHDVVHIRR